MRIVQISDTHLSPDKPLYVENWAPLAAWIADQHPDLVIHTGDVTADGAGVEADLSFSAQLMDELGIRWRAVPGNHDVGDPRDADQPVHARRPSAWQRHFGPDRWVEDIAEGAQHGASFSLPCVPARSANWTDTGRSALVTGTTPHAPKLTFYEGRPDSLERPFGAALR